MKEQLAEVMVAGAFLLSPHPTNQETIAGAPPAIEMLAANESMASVQHTQPENSELTGSNPIENAVDRMYSTSDHIPTVRADSYHSIGGLEGLDPQAVTVLLEVGLGSIGLGSVTGLVTSRRLKKSLRRKHAAIKNDGVEAHLELHTALEAAKQQAAGLHDDDVPQLRELIKKHDATFTTLSNALASTDSEFDAERRRVFPLKRRLRREPHTDAVAETTPTAAKQAQKLQKELERVRTDLNEIDTNIDRAGNAVASLQHDLDMLTQRGWDVSTYNLIKAGYADAVVAARARRAEHYIDEPTKIAKETISKAADLREKANALESRRFAADEAHDTHTDQIEDAETTAEAIRKRFTKLEGKYSAACLVDFEDLHNELTQATTKLRLAHDTGSGLTGKQGMSVEAVKQSERLIKSFDKTFQRIQTIGKDLETREDDLAELAEQLPIQVNMLSAQFDRAMGLTNDPDVGDKAAAAIESLSGDIAGLSASISTVDGRKPDYLDIEQRHLSLAEAFNQAYTKATQQKQEMAELRINVPQLASAHNQLVKTLAEYANRSDVSLYDETRNSINALMSYDYEIASDRKNLRKQHDYLKRQIRNIDELMEQAEEEAGEDSPLLAGAKVVGLTALAIVGIDLLEG